MKTFVNFRFLAVLILALAVAGAAVHGLHVLQLRRHAGFLLEQAHRAAEDKEYPLAVSRFQQYTSLEPGDSDALAEFGLLLADLGQRKAASATLEKVLRSQPEHARQALKLAPDEVDACLLVAQLASAQGLHDEARRHAQRAIELDPKRAAGYSILAHTELRTNHRKEAMACLERGLEKASPRNELLWALGRLQIEEGNLAQAQKTVDQFRAEAPANPLADYLPALLDFARGHWQQAARGFDQLVAKFADSPDMLKEVHRRRAVCYQRLGNREQELAAYREAARVDPLWRPAQLGIAATLAALGKHNEALEQYRQIAKLAAAAKDSQQNPAEAAQVMSEIAGLLLLKNLRLPPAERDWSEVNSLVDRLIQANPEAAGPVILRAEALVGQERTAEAEKVLSAARDKLSDQREPWGALLALAARKNSGTARPRSSARPRRNLRNPATGPGSASPKASAC
jgi:tetratricopeptide (TPR) repeat protein